MNTIRMPAEWEEQDGVILAWPHEATDWNPCLHAARETLARIVAVASHHARVLLLINAPDSPRHALKSTDANPARVTFIPAPYNDIWARDYGPITVIENGHPVLLDFQFNGWGGKHPHHLDNVVTSGLKEQGAFGPTPLRRLPLILEGGSIDSDGHGTVLTTTSCNLNLNRNAHWARSDMEQAFRRFFGATRVLWLQHGYLRGDDTDGHVDMLARFAPHDTLVYQSCNNPLDEHFEALQAMTEELRAFRTAAGQPYRLIPLPWPSARYDEKGERLPASYANFLVLNDGVLVPVYGDEHDTQALRVIGQAFPRHKITGIDCSILIRHHGSLHCVTMQLPRGVLP